MADEGGIPFLWLIVTIIIVGLVASLNFFGVINNLAYILITAGFLIIGFLLGIFLQGSGGEMTGFGLKMLLIGILLLIIYFLW